MSPEATPPQAQFQILNLVVTKAIYEFLGVAAPQDKERPVVLNVGIEISASAQIAKDGTAAFVKLDTKVLPDQEWQPYRIEVGIGAAFSSQGGTADDLLKFCQIVVPSILFPYIRETVHRLTSDAPNGPVRLNPMYISQLLNQTDWNVIETPSLGLTDSTELPPPSGQ